MSSQRTPPIAIDNARNMLLDSISPFEELEVVSLDEISEDEYDEFAEGIEKN